MSEETKSTWESVRKLDIKEGDWLLWGVTCGKQREHEILGSLGWQHKTLLLQRGVCKNIKFLPVDPNIRQNRETDTNRECMILKLDGVAPLFRDPSLFFAPPLCKNSPFLQPQQYFCTNNRIQIVWDLSCSNGKNILVMFKLPCVKH